MKNVKKIIIAAAVLPLALGTASAYAFGGKGDHKGGYDGHGKCGGEEMGKRMFRQLDLTDEQKTQLKEMKQANRSAMKGKMGAQGAEKMAERQAHHAKVQALVLADTFDAEAANALAAEMVEQQTERRVKMLEKKHEMLSILTPEQKVKFTELQNERMAKCSEKMQDRMEKKNKNKS